MEAEVGWDCGRGMEGANIGRPGYGESVMVYSHCLSPEHRNRDRKNGLYEIMQNISHYTGTGTPLFPIVLFTVPVQVLVPE